MTPSSREPDVHVHPDMHEPVVSIGGHYELTGEHELTVGRRRVLYATGVAILDTSCCGVTGCAYAVVAGYRAEGDAVPDAGGHRRSHVERIRDPAEQAAVRAAIEACETVTQVVFR